MLEVAVEAGVTFFDTADVYGDGRSEQLIGRFVNDNPDLVLTVATKMGRRVDQVPENYTLANFRAWADRSRHNLGVDRLDLVQLHCPPTAVYSADEVYDALDELVDDGVIAAYGVSVETVDEALTAISRRGTATVQIILNAFRHKPLEYVLPAARQAGVGHHRPGAAGQRPAQRALHHRDHLRRERPPQLQPARQTFDVGETFSGVDYEPGSRRPRRSPNWSGTGSRRDPGPGRTGLDHPDRRHHRHPRRPLGGQVRANAAAGGGGAAGRVPRRGADLRPAAAGGDPPALVTS